MVRYPSHCTQTATPTGGNCPAPSRSFRIGSFCSVINLSLRVYGLGYANTGSVDAPEIWPRGEPRKFLGRGKIRNRNSKVLADCHQEQILIDGNGQNGKTTPKEIASEQRSVESHF